MTYDVSYCTWVFLKINTPLFVQLTHGYTSSTVCKINFGFIFLTLTWNALFKNVATESFHQQPGRNQKPLYFQNCDQCIHYHLIMPHFVEFPQLQWLETLRNTSGLLITLCRCRIFYTLVHLHGCTLWSLGG